jgi:exosome complex RNA-binding protein Rrp4
MMIITCLVSRLLSSPTCPVLEALGKKLSFEIAVGLNGRVWVYFLKLYFTVSNSFILYNLLLIWASSPGHV